MDTISNPTDLVRTLQVLHDLHSEQMDNLKAHPGALARVRFDLWRGVLGLAFDQCKRLVQKLPDRGQIIHEHAYARPWIERRNDPLNRGPDTQALLPTATGESS